MLASGRAAAEASDRTERAAMALEMSIFAVDCKSDGRMGLKFVLMM
jgi:hypothetical protein